MVLAFCLASTSPFRANAENADVDGVCTAEYPCLEPEVDSMSLLQRGFQAVESKTMKSSSQTSASTNSSSRPHPLCKDYTKAFDEMDVGALDKDGDGCRWYKDHIDQCGLHDGDTFLANEMCCVCGGGSTSKLPRSLAVNGASVFVSDGSCPDGFAPLTTLGACRASLDLLAMHGMEYRGEESSADWPKGCYHCHHINGCQNGVWFNSHSEGEAVEGVRQICHKNYDPADVKTLFVGDSDIDFWDSSFAFPGSFNVGVGGYTTQEVKREVDKWVDELDPEWVVIVCGENDLNRKRKNTRKAFGRFESIVKKFIQDGSRVIYLGTKPEPGTTSLHDEYKFYDQSIRHFAREQASGTTTPPFVMIDVFEVFKSRKFRKKQLYNSDDLHMSRNGYKYWNQWVKQAMSSTDPCIRWRDGSCAEMNSDDDDDYYY